MTPGRGGTIEPETRLRLQSEMGARIRRARLAAGMTQREMAAKLNMTQGALHRTETGQRNVLAIELVPLAEILNVSVVWLLRDPAPREDDSEVTWGDQHNLLLAVAELGQRDHRTLLTLANYLAFRS